MNKDKKTVNRSAIEFLKELVPISYVWEPSKLQLDTLKPGQVRIGIIIQPGPNKGLAGFFDWASLLTTNASELANLWGHTALYIREANGTINAVGFDPNRIAMFNFLGESYKRVSTGVSPTKGYVYDEVAMFQSPDSICVEFDLDEISGGKPGEIVAAISEEIETSKKQALSGELKYSTVKRDSVDTESNEVNCIEVVQKWLKSAGLKLKLPDIDLSKRQGILTKYAYAQQIELDLLDSSRQTVGLKRTMPRAMQLTRRVGSLNQTWSVISTVSNFLYYRTGWALFRPSLGYKGAPLAVTLVGSLLIEALPDEYKSSKSVLRLMTALSNVGGTVLLLWTLLCGGKDVNRLYYFIYMIIGLFSTVISGRLNDLNIKKTQNQIKKKLK